jgi:HEAT repeats
MSDRWAISPLIRGLRDRLWHIRHEAVHGLGCLGPLLDWALPSLARALEDSEPAVRGEAAYALGRLPSPDSLRPLVLALDDGSRTVRLAGAWALEHLAVDGIAHERAAERLGRLMEQDCDPFVSYAAYCGFRAPGRPGRPGRRVPCFGLGSEGVGRRPAGDPFRSWTRRPRTCARRGEQVGTPMALMYPRELLAGESKSRGEDKVFAALRDSRSRAAASSAAPANGRPCATASVSGSRIRSRRHSITATTCSARSTGSTAGVGANC